MEGVPAVYLGRIVPKEGFRTFIYSPDGSQKLVESWDEFESHMETGIWFATPEETQGSKEVPQASPKKGRQSEVKQDDSLSKASK